MVPRECCPADIPYCRSFMPSGVGCYASSATQVSSMSRLFSIINLPRDDHVATSSPQSDAGSSGILNPMVPTDIGLLPPVEISATITSTSTTTKTLTVIANSGHFTAVFPPKNTPAVVPAPMVTIVTIWEIVQVTIDMMSSSVAPSTSTAYHSAHPPYHPSISLPLPTSAVQPDTTTSESTTQATSADTSKSALCFNADLQTNLPCTTSTISTDSSTSTTAPDLDPPGVLLVPSSGNRPDNLIGRVFLALFPHRERARPNQCPSPNKSFVSGLVSKISSFFRVDKKAKGNGVMLTDGNCETLQEDVWVPLNAMKQAAQQVMAGFVKPKTKSKRGARCA